MTRLMSRLRFSIGPILIGLAVWCAAGQITVVNADSATTRLAVGAPWWTVLLGTAAAWLVPPWRRDARLALPAVLSTLPWWPLPIPAIALTWTGPLAWAPLVAACALALGALAPSARTFVARWSVTGAAALTLIFVVMTAWAAAPQSPQGDEPHYLVATQSLLKDGDLRVENNYRQRDYAAYFNGRLTPDYDRRATNGAIYSIHPIGLSILVLPAFALFGYRGAEMVVVLLAAITGGLIWRIGWRTTDDPAAAWFAWAVIVLTPAFLFHSFAMFPESLGALVVAANTLLLVRLVRSGDTVSTARLVGTSILQAAFPWLHARFAILAAGFAALIAWHILRDRRRTVASRLARTSAFLLVPLASAIGWLAFFWTLYGTADPKGAHGIIELRVDRIPRGVLGLAFDQQYGLLPYTPALAIVGVGLFRSANVRMRHCGWLLFALALAYLVTTVSYRMDEMWWAGLPSAPARYAVAVLPVFALFIASAWTRATPGARRAWLVLLLISACVSTCLALIDRGALAWNVRDGHARWLEWLAPLVNLPRGWPSYFWEFPALAPFVLHTALWIGIPAGLWAAGSWIGRRTAWSETTCRVACAWWAAGSLMAVVQAGWWMNATNGLDPARSQLGVLAAVARRGRAITIRPFAMARDADAIRGMVIRPEQAGKYERHPPLARFADMPAGRYLLRLWLAEARAGTVAVNVEGASRRGRVLNVPAASRPSIGLELPGGAGQLALIADDGLQPIVRALEISPVLISRPGPSPTQRGLRSGSTELFFLDDQAYVEDNGFWVRGRGAAHVVLAGEPGQHECRLFVRNGAAANLVTLDAGSYQRRFPLRAFEERLVALPVDDPGGVLTLRIDAAVGFRPSNISASSDRRLLGVWIELR